MTSETPQIPDVDQLTEEIRQRVSSMGAVMVRGEVQGFKRHTSGHVYFTLLGPTCRVGCAIFRSSAERILMWPEDGDQVALQGKLDIYGPRGSYQIIGTRVWPLGAGAQARQKALLKERLASEGLFDPMLKRPFPLFPSRVAVITSPTGAAFHDVQQVASVRYPACHILWVQSQVQGAGAVCDMVRALRLCASIRDLSCIMLVRGGGSRDDLNPFDDEAVVRAVRGSPHPVISGVGHEVDTTLCDLAADAVAPTPSAAAERIFPDSMEWLRWVEGSSTALRNAILRRIEAQEQQVEHFRRSMYKNLISACGVQAGRLDFMRRHTKQSALHAVRAQGLRLHATREHLKNLSPMATMARGYAVVLKTDGSIVRCPDDTKAGEHLIIRWSSGEIRVTVNSAER